MLDPYDRSADSIPKISSILDLDAVLEGRPQDPLAPGSSRRRIGTSREGRPIYGHVFGTGPLHVSLIGGCHADEPVGPAMLDRLVAWLEGLAASGTEHEALLAFHWRIVPHVNPDGEARNETWTSALGDPADWTRERPLVCVDLPSYLRHVVREPPGDDVEFGFPGPDEYAFAARPENEAVASFLEEAAPYGLHGSFHGMGFAAGPWFLIERSWADPAADRTSALRQEMRSAVRAGGYEIHDVDRGGDKGFERLDEGFTSRPDSRAMRAHFEAAGDPETASLFRPSSMEFVRSLGGDPLTLVSEMPLFVVPADEYRRGDLVRPPAVREIKSLALAGAAPDEELTKAADRLGIRPMPIRDQMRFQLAFLDAALRTVRAEGQFAG